MTASKHDQQELTLGQLLAKVSRLVGARMRAGLEAIGLPYAYGMILFRLWKKDGIAQNVLAKSLYIHRQQPPAPCSEWSGTDGSKDAGTNQTSGSSGYISRKRPRWSGMKPEKSSGNWTGNWRP